MPYNPILAFAALACFGAAFASQAHAGNNRVDPVIEPTLCVRNLQNNFHAKAPTSLASATFRCRMTLLASAEAARDGALTPRSPPRSRWSDVGRNWPGVRQLAAFLGQRRAPTLSH